MYSYFRKASGKVNMEIQNVFFYVYTPNNLYKPVQVVNVNLKVSSFIYSVRDNLISRLGALHVWTDLGPLSVPGGPKCQVQPLRCLPHANPSLEYQN